MAWSDAARAAAAEARRIHASGTPRPTAEKQNKMFGQGYRPKIVGYKPNYKTPGGKMTYKGHMSYLSQYSFKTRAEATNYAKSVLSGLRSGYKY